MSYIIFTHDVSLLEENPLFHAEAFHLTEALLVISMQRCRDTSDPGHFRPKTFRLHQTGTVLSAV